MRALLTIFLLAFAFTAFCQEMNTNFVDGRLINLYSPSQLEHLKTKNPQLLARLNFYLDNGFIITEQHEEKTIGISNEVVINDLENFNILLLEKEQNLKRSMEKISIYKIKGTNKLLVFHSERNFNKDFLKHYKKLNSK